MENGYVVISRHGSKVCSAFIGKEKASIPWAPQIRGQGIDNGILVSGKERWYTNTAKIIGNRWTTLHKAVRYEDQKIVVHLNEEFVSGSEEMWKIFHQIVLAKDVIEPILIIGETGTGKEMVAKALHALGRGSHAPFMAINLAALPSELAESELFGWVKGAFTGAIESRVGLFESAKKGTVFLDEIGEASPALQSKLLRVIETRRVVRLGSTKETLFDARIISATNKDLFGCDMSTFFRLDLLERVSCVVIKIPPLRERIEDIDILARHFLYQLDPDCTITEPALNELRSYLWPGNARELKNVILRAKMTSIGNKINVSQIREAIRVGNPLKFEKRPTLFCSVADGCNKEYTVKDLIGKSGIPKSTFYYRLKRGKLGINT